MKFVLALSKPRLSFLGGDPAHGQISWPRSRSPGSMGRRVREHQPAAALSRGMLSFVCATCFFLGADQLPAGCPLQESLLVSTSLTRPPAVLFGLVASQAEIVERLGHCASRLTALESRDPLSRLHSSPRRPHLPESVLALPASPEMHRVCQTALLWGV